MKHFRSRQGIPAFPAAYCVEYAASTLMKDTYGKSCTHVIYAFMGNTMDAFIDTQEDFSQMNAAISNIMLTDKEYVKNLVKKTFETRNSLKEYLYKTFPKEEIENLSSAELSNRYKEYVELYRAFHLMNTPSWWISSDSIYARLKEKIVDEQSCLLLTESLEHQSETMEENRVFLDTMCIIKSTDIQTQSQVIETEISTLVDSFEHVSYGYFTGKLFNEEYYREKIMQYLASTKDPRKELEELDTALKIKKEKQDKLMMDLGLDNETKHIIEVLRDLTYLQELKKTTQTKSHPYLYRVVWAELAKKLGCNIDDFKWISHQEIIDGLSRGKLADHVLSQVSKRSTKSVLFMKDLNYEWLTEKDADEFFQQQGLHTKEEALSELKGITASVGKVTGRAKICHSSLDVNKLKPGDILISGMTTPDYILGMKISGAIVTDEGGITCHAAIVSRELKIPCIIGTKKATKIFHDGDLLEVDGSTGIVRKITQ